MQATEVDRYAAYETLEIERRDDGVLLVTMNRPEVLNAMSWRMHTELATIWDDVKRDPATKVVVLTGAGRAFCAGNDLKQGEPDRRQRLQTMEEASEIVFGMIGLKKPIVSAIHGPAVGAGLAVALLADVSIATEDAKLIDGHTRVGVAAGDHAALIWPLLCGMAKAKYYLMTNEPLSGTEAERIGLVTKVVPPGRDVDEALAVAARLARGAQEAIGWTKHALNQWLHQAGPIFEHSKALELLNMLAGEDVNEARAAFREGREPNFPSAQLR
ncbi:MAG TPA: enoyl-CoA hydratase/isomerase family protein [Solirubrobacteraceae bacterium]|nr:enoyl-CoA hydratase/isomerase family protein [Solirubrobacteraceae bacterium]